MKNVTGMLGGVFLAILSLWGPGITLASAATIEGVEIDRAAVLQELQNDPDFQANPELRAEVGNLMDRLEAGDNGAKAEIAGAVEQIQHEEAAPVEAASAAGGAAPVEAASATGGGEGTLGGEGVGVTATESVEAAAAPEATEAPQADITPNAPASETQTLYTWCDGTTDHTEPDPGCP